MNTQDPNLVFIKLGGSLITDKAMPRTARRDVLTQAATDIKQALSVKPDLRLVIGHGSGSYGHIPARKYGTRKGVNSPQAWKGFAEVWQEARRLNEIVLEHLLGVELPVIAFPPSACITSDAGHVVSWNLDPLWSTLAHGLIPLVYGDVVFDSATGGTILSTEDLFVYLAGQLRPSRILLAGIEPGVWSSFPERDRIIDLITPGIKADKKEIFGSDSPDVTGGMETKVDRMLDCIYAVPGLEIEIFSGLEKNSILTALTTGTSGTRIRAN
jgi:isopentenyl phosphate kinase